MPRGGGPIQPASAHRATTPSAAAVDHADMRELVHRLSHDLSEPLRAVTGFAGLLEARVDGLDDKGREYLAHVIRGADHLQLRLQALREMALLGTTVLRIESVALDEVVAETIDALAAPIAATGARIEVGALPRVAGDRKGLRRVFENLVDNAIRHRAEAEPRLQVAASPGPEGWVVSVADNGPGIPESDRERVFEIFAQLQRNESAAGIGLAIVRRIVELHGGTVSVESSPTGGASFRLVLHDAPTGRDR